jgi:hypothetical protein
MTGVVWGLVIGAVAAVFTVAAAAGFSWLYLFGDEPWPDSVDWVLPALGLGAFLAVLLGCVAWGLRAGQRTAAAVPEAAARRLAGARRLLAIGILLALVLAGTAVARIAGQQDARETAARQAAIFGALQSARQRLTAVSVSRAPRPMGYDLTVRTQGARGGAYRLTWALRASGTGEILAEGTSSLTLDPGENRANLPLDARAIITRYHDLVLGGRAVTVEVGERFRIEATLAPVLDEAERARLAPREIQSLSLGQSALIDRATTELDIEFRIQGRHYELLE